MEVIRVRERVLPVDQVIEREAIQLSEVADCNLARLAAVAVVDQPAQNLGEPRSDPLDVPECRERAEGLHVRLLHEVLGVLGSSLEADCQSVEMTEVRQREGLESLLHPRVQYLPVGPLSQAHGTPYQRDGLAQPENSPLR